jgi:hypothetical protein
LQYKIRPADNNFSKTQQPSSTSTTICSPTQSKHILAQSFALAEHYHLFFTPDLSSTFFSPALQLLRLAVAARDRRPSLTLICQLPLNRSEFDFFSLPF